MKCAASVSLGSNLPFAADLMKVRSGLFDTNSKLTALNDRLLLGTALAPYEPKFVSFADCRTRIGLSF